jgi:hypothetical protein
MSALTAVFERAGRYARKQAFKRVYRRHRDATMLDEHAYVANLRLVADWMRTHDPSAGSIVECGTWRGGMLFGLVETCPSVQEFHAFDSFAGLPPAGPLDGEEPARLQERGELVAGNNVATLERFPVATQGAGADQAIPLRAHPVHPQSGAAAAPRSLTVDYLKTAAKKLVASAMDFLSASAL